jgi:calcium/calmodulin-dependent protein kinase I
MGNVCSSDGGPKEDLTASPGKRSKRISREPTFSKVHARLRQDCTVRDAYKIGKTIGTGGFSVVKRVVDRDTGENMACKIMTLPPEGASAGDGESTRMDIFKEIDIIMSLRHDNIIYMKEYFEESGRVYVIMEYLAGGELLEALLRKDKGEDGNEPHYSEQDARVIFKQLIEAVKYMHDKQIVHRDLKLENMLLKKPNDIRTIKIADFGLAKKYGHAALSTICGTPQYVAPEVIKGGNTPYTYGKECDLWSCGVILFILLGGYPPFYDESEPRLFRKIREGIPDMNDPVWDEVSKEAKDLIMKLLDVDPPSRLTVEGVLEHPWMNPPASSPTSKKDLLRTMSKMKTSFKTKSLTSP